MVIEGERSVEGAGKRPLLEGLRKEVADMRSKLEESRAQVASNEQMIRWLNNQITETQLHYSSTAVGGAVGAGLLASRYSYRPPAPMPPAGTGSSGSTAAAVGPSGVSTAGGALPGGRPAVSTYRTPATAGLTGASTVGSTALPPSSGGSTGASGAPASSRGPFRSSFYATNFGGSGAGSGSGPAAPPANPVTARSLDLSGRAASPQAPAAAAGAGAAAAAPRSQLDGISSAAGAPAGAATAAAPAAARSSQVAAPTGAAAYLSSRLFEAPTYRMADTAGGRVAVPVTSGI